MLQLGISKIFSSMFWHHWGYAPRFLLKLDSSLMLLERPQVTARNFFFQNQNPAPLHALIRSLFFHVFPIFSVSSDIRSSQVISGHLISPCPSQFHLSSFHATADVLRERIACRHTVQTTMHSLEIWETTCLLNAQIYQFTVFRCLTGIR